MKINNSACTQEVVGKIEAVRVRGQDFPTMITVSYPVDGKTYEITESIKLKSEKIKLGFLPIGQKRVPTMGNTAVGSPARVRYNPANPGEAYLIDNTGKANV